MRSTIEKFHEKYFEIVEDYFGIHYKRMKEKKQSFKEAINQILRIYDNRVLVDSIVEPFLEETYNMDWERLQASIREQDGVKTVHETSTVGLTNAIKRTSLYADTCVVEMFTYARQSERTVKAIHPQSTLWFLAIDALSLLEAKEVFLADVTPPIAVLDLPPVLADQDKLKACQEMIEHDNLEIFSNLFGVKASSSEEIEKFVAKHENPESLFRNLKKVNPFTDSKDYDFRTEFAHMLDTINFGRYGSTKEIVVTPSILAETVQSTISGATLLSQLISAGTLHAHPIVREKGEWCRLCWKFKEDSRLLSKKIGFKAISVDFLLVNALSLHDFKWLGNVPIDAIVKMRADGDLQEMRNILGEGINEVENVGDEEFLNTSKQVSHNLNQAFERHRAEVKRLDEEYRRKYLTHGVALTVGGSISVASTIFQPLGYVAGIIGLSSIRDLISNVLEKRSEMEELRRKPIGLLFEAYQDKTRKTPKAFKTRCVKCNRKIPIASEKCQYCGTNQTK